MFVLNSSEELVEMFNNVSLGIVAINDRGEMVMVNRFALKQFGYSDEKDLTGKQSTLLIPHNHTDKTTTELHGIKKSGLEFPVEVSFSPFETRSGHYTLAFISDISVRKNAERALLQTNKDLEQKVHEFGALFNNAAIGIVTVNKISEIVMCNPYALKQFGYTEQELVGKKIELLIPSRYQDKHVSHRDKYNIHPHNRTMGIGLDLFAMKKDGTEFPVEVSLSPYSTSSGQFTIAFISDITIRKEAEKALLDLNTELEQKVKDRTESLIEALAKEKDLNEMKSRFVSMASHEFRTPLSTILSSAYLALKYETTEEQPKREKHIRRVVSSVNMLIDILNEFLSLGRIEEGKIQVRTAEFDIHEMTNGIINEMSNNLKQGQSFEYSHTGLDLLKSDPSLMTHIMMNLFSNAIKFSPENSVISVCTKHCDDTFTLTVKDRGVGISAEDREHLFERFFRGRNVSNIQGTGLGLHIIKKYAELLNGTITCDSELDQGAEFIVTLKNTCKLS